MESIFVNNIGKDQLELYKSHDVDKYIEAYETYIGIRKTTRELWKDYIQNIDMKGSNSFRQELIDLMNNLINNVLLVSGCNAQTPYTSFCSYCLNPTIDNKIKVLEELYMETLTDKQSIQKYVL